MRIAALIYGRLNFCGENYENLRDKLGREHTVDFFMSSDNAPQNLLDEFLHVYHPISYINDPITHEYNFGKYPNIRTEVNVENMTRHFINLSRVFSLFDSYIQSTDIKYDIILSIRIDLVYSTTFLFNQIQENTIYIPQGYDFIPNAIKDQLAYGSYTVMKLYSNLINIIHTLVETNKSIVHPESLVFANLRYHSINTVRFPLSYYIKR